MSSRRRKAARALTKCRTCHALKETTDPPFYRGLCTACRAAEAVQRRALTAARALAKAKPAGTVLRDGHTYTVTVLPPKRRGGNRH